MRRYDRPACRWLLLLILVTLMLSGCQQEATTPTLVDVANVPGTASPSIGATAQPPQATTLPAMAPPQATAMPTRADATPMPESTKVMAKSSGAIAQPGTIGQAMYEGDYGLAIQHWEAKPLPLRKNGPLVLDVAHAYLAEDRPFDAVELLVTLAEASDETQVLAPTLGLLGATYADMGEWQAAIDAYQRHLDLSDAASPQVRWRMAQAHQALGDHPAALAVLDAIDLASLATSRRAEVLEEIAQLYRETEEYSAALDAYDQILAFARQSNYRALVQHYRAQTLVEADQLDHALAQWQTIIAQTPDSFAGALALDALDQHQVANLDGLARGRILYHARRYQPAQAALQAFVYATTDERLAEAYYLLGLTYAASDQFGPAFDAYDTVIQDHTDSDWVAKAWLAKANAEDDYGGDPSGLFYEFARLYPQHTSAAEALWQGAQYLEGAQAWERAERYYGLVEEKYADSDHAQEAAFRRGLMLYADGRYAQALDQWQAELPDGLAAEERAKWLTWTGLAADHAGVAATAYWQDAHATAPLTYYGLRGSDLASQVGGNTPHTASLVLEDLTLSKGQWREIERWISDWYSGTGSIALDLTEDRITRQAVMLEQLGWHAEAMETMRGLYDNHLGDPHALAEIARFCLAQDWYSPMILAANRLRWLGQQAGAAEAPDALWRLSYPIVYSRLIAAYAQQYDMDPLLMLALMRQESRFDGRALSYAGAQGLAQVMPDTGKWIAERLGQADYRTAWLERPQVSVSYGAWFMRTLLDLYDEDTVAMLVAYNAGPGNLSRWTNDAAITDHDLFVETLPLQQPQDYVTWITIQHHVYKHLYGAP